MQELQRAPGVEFMKAAFRSCRTEPEPAQNTDGVLGLKLERLLSSAAGRLVRLPF